MRQHRLRASWILLPSIALLAAQFAPEVSGPGLGNLTYAPSELFNPISVIHSPQGHGMVTMVNGYLLVPFSSDSGGSQSDGGFEFWDVSDPRQPLLAVRYDNVDTHGIREAHGFGLSRGNPGGHPTDYLVVQADDGIQFWDVTDPLNMSLLGYMTLPGIHGGDYTGDWWVFWQAPYVYVAGTSEGLYIVDATDPVNPTLARHIPTGDLGGFNPGQTFAIGNLLVLAENNGDEFVTMSIADPTNPRLIQHAVGRPGYSHLFAGGWILTSGTDDDPDHMIVSSVGHDGTITFVGAVGIGLANGGYGSYQDGFFHSGFSSKYAKFDIASLTQVGTGSSGIAGRDEDFAHVLGNLVFVGDDHGVGSALIPHQIAPDTTGPKVDWVHPGNGAVNQLVTSRVGLSMSDSIDLDSVTSATFIVRPHLGAPLPGRYSVQMGLVNFSPDTPLQPGTTYDVIVSGMRDLAGNPGPAFQSSFTTAAGSNPVCTLEPLSPALTGAPVTFDVGSVSGSGTIDYSWQFSDGSSPTPPSVNATVTHTFAAPGR